MKYFHLQFPKDKNAAYLVSKPSDAKKTWFGKFRVGAPVQGKVPPLFATTSPDCGNKLFDAIANVNDDFIITQRFLTVLTSLGVKNLETFPVAIVDNETGSKSPYLICNVIGTIACIDRKRAKVTWESDDPGQAFWIKKLAVDPKAIETFNKGRDPGAQFRLFRLEESRAVLLASEEIEIAVTAAGITGVEFQKV